MSPQPHAWLRHGRVLQRKINLGHWIDQAAVPMVTSTAAAAAGVLWVRYQWPTFHAPWLLAMAIALPLMACMATLWSARRSFVSLSDALVRLEVIHGLHSALSTAHAGMGEWPPVPKRFSDGLRWRWSRAAIPLLLAASLMAGAWFIPISESKIAESITQPASWELVESSLDTLIEKQLVEPRSTQDTQKAIDALRSQPQEKWFDHSSIEASDRVLLDHQRDVAQLERRMRDAARALRDAARAQQGAELAMRPDDPTLSTIPNELNMGDLKPNQELIEKLQQMLNAEAGGLAPIDPRQLAELLDQLDKNAEMLQQMMSQFQGLPEIDPSQMAGDAACPNPDCKDGKCPGGPGHGQEGKEGQGAPNRGPGEGGPLFGQNKNGLDAQTPIPLTTEDLSRTIPGERIGVSETTHDIDPSRSPNLHSGGAPIQPGDGGAAVWQDSLNPQEQEALRKFFE